MGGDGPNTTRRRFARALSRVANANVTEILAAANPEPDAPAWRIGITGPPGAGKSSLISRLARLRLARFADPSSTSQAGRLAVLAVDPSSPVGGGAILGDRIRMDELSADPRVYIRSLASRGGRDGLAHNIVDLLALVDDYGFDEALLETVGVGQAEHAARLLVDSLVLVLHPESGDSVQAMKSGIMEVADIFVVNKADLPGAVRTATELRAVLKATASRNGWTPPVIEIGRDKSDGLAALDTALEDHRASVRRDREEATIRRARRRYRLMSLLQRRIDEVLDADPDILDHPETEAGYRAALQGIAGSCVEPPARAASGSR